MTTLTKPNFVATGAVGMAIAIGLGAFGAHALKPLLGEEARAVYETAVFYLLLHALALTAIPFKKQTAWLMITGTVFFSGSLLLLATRTLHGIQVNGLGPVTPIGGVLLIAAWLHHAYTTIISKAEKRALPK